MWSLRAFAVCNDVQLAFDSPASLLLPYIPVLVRPPLTLALLQFGSSLLRMETVPPLLCPPLGGVWAASVLLLVVVVSLVILPLVLGPSLRQKKLHILVLEDAKVSDGECGCLGWVICQQLVHVLGACPEHELPRPGLLQIRAVAEQVLDGLLRIPRMGSKGCPSICPRCVR